MTRDSDDDGKDGPNNEATGAGEKPGDADYRVGPGCPPKEHQFKPGQSGNPKGRKPKPPSLALDFEKTLNAALKKPVKVRDGERERVLTRFEFMVEQLAIQAAKGDRHARRDLLIILQKHGPNILARDGGASSKNADTWSSAEQAILNDWLKRHGGTPEETVGEAKEREAQPDLPDAPGAGADKGGK